MSKTVLLSVLLIVSQCCFAQLQQNCDAVYHIKIRYRPALLEILGDTNRFASSPITNTTKITYVDIPPGRYKIRISGPGQTTEVIDSIFIAVEQHLILSVNVEGPCLYDHAPGYIPVCPKNHKDEIIPIVYGLILERGNTFVKDRKELKVIYGGCVTSGCDPQFYCKEHDIEF